MTPVTPYWVQVMHTGLPCAMKEAARKICKNAKKLKVEDGSEVAMAAVAVLFGKTQIQQASPGDAKCEPLYSRCVKQNNSGWG